jgi:hypothetical protein
MLAAGGIDDQIRKMLTAEAGFNSGCPSGATCSDEKTYNGKTIEVIFTGQELPLNPDNFKFNVGVVREKTFVRLWGTIKMTVEEGSIGSCKQDK